MVKKYSIILNGKSITSLISFAAKKFNVPKSEIQYEIISNPDEKSKLFKVKLFTTNIISNNVKRQKIKFTLTDHKTKLYLTSFPLEIDETPYDVEEIENVLVNTNKIKCKIDKWEIKRSLTLSTKTKKESKVLIGQGVSSQTGDNGIIEILSTFLDNSNNPIDNYIKEPKDILYKCNFVEKNSIIAIIHKPKKGNSGVNVYGQRIAGLNGKEIEYSLDKHIIAIEHPNSIELRVPESGRVTYYKNLFRFYQVVKKKTPISGNKTNIKVEGDLIIDEYIENGAKVNVKGNLKVKDDIFNAFVDCHGDLTVENGISNSKKGFITINGNLKCSFLQNALVLVENNIQLSKAILNSNVYCGGKIDISNGGIIRNSKLFVKDSITTEKIENCEIICGITFSASQKLKSLNKNLEQLKIDKEVLEKKIGKNFLQVAIEELHIENEMIKEVYKKKRDLREINLNIESINKEINEILTKNFNTNCYINVNYIAKNTIIKMKDKEYIVPYGMENINISYNIEKNQIAIYNNNIGK